MRIKFNHFIDFSILIIILLINFIGSYVFNRFDLTKEGRYSLSETTKKLLSEIDDYIYIEVYLEGDFPPGIERLSLETKQILSEFKTKITEQYKDVLFFPSFFCSSIISPIKLYVI